MSLPLIIPPISPRRRRSGTSSCPLSGRAPSILDKTAHTIVSFKFKGKHMAFSKTAIQDVEKAVQAIAEFCNFSSREKFHLRTEELIEFYRQKIDFYLNDGGLWRRILEQSSTMEVIQDEPENTGRGTVRADNYLAIVSGAAGSKQIHSVHLGVYSVSNIKRDITVVYGPQTTVGDVLKEYIRIYDKPSELNFRWMGGADILNPSSRWTVYGFTDGEVLHEVLPL